MIHLYVEHLLNIRTLSIQAALSTVSNKETKATLSADGATLNLTHEGESACIKLPINLSPKQESKVKITIPAVPSRELSFRVQLEEKDGEERNLLSNVVREGGNVIPWTANSLTDDTEVCCGSCNCVLFERGNIQTWKDLPSEGWAEMMEFWHCHKPHEPHSHLNGDLNKGYAAGSKLAIESGVGLVDVADILFAADDCKNITIRDSPENGVNEGQSLACGDCKATIGQIEPSTRAYSLRKLHVSLSTHSGSPPIKHSMEKWIACILLSAMDNQGVRKFVARNNASDMSKALKLWIFAPDLMVSSSAMASAEPARFAKVMWQEAERLTENGERLNASAFAEGELKLQGDEANMLEDLLKRNSGLVPESARHFQEWNVGLLERFANEDAAPS